MLKKLLLISIFIRTISGLQAQVYTEKKTRHRFAQLNLGLDVRSFTSHGTNRYVFSTGNQLVREPLPDQSELRLLIGGTHFWGHADFYLAFPLVSYGQSGFLPEIETGARFYPWQIKNKKLRPYAGISWLPSSYQQGDATTSVQHQFPLSLGCTFNWRNSLFDIGFHYINSTSRSYYIQQTNPVTIQTHSMALSVGYKRMIETTLGAEKNWQNGKTAWLTDTLSKLGRLNGFSVGLGMSAALFLKSSSINRHDFPFLDQHVIAGPVPEFGLGYYFHKPQLHFNLTYRKIKSKLEAFGYRQEATRRSLGLEAFKFIGDYHGFAAFVGPIISYEHWELINRSPQQKQRFSKASFKPGLIMGWDIRPNEIQSWYLRTNLRWFPQMHLPTGHFNFRFDQLEINFIQLVIYPQRLF